MRKRILVLGGGVSGLTLAWNLQRKIKYAAITLIEKNQMGGWLQTIDKGGFLFDAGPRACRTSGTGVETLKLIEALGLEKEVLVADPQANKRYLYLNQKLQPFPRPWSFVGSLIKECWRSKGNGDDESIYDFMIRRFNKTIAENYIDPMVSGIFAGDMRALSVQACFPQLYEWEQEYGSIVRGVLFQKKLPVDSHSAFVKQMQKSPLISFRKGMGTLPNALIKQLDNVEMIKGEIDGFEFEKDSITVLVNEKKIHADSVFSALPPNDIGKLLSPFDATFDPLFQKISSASVAVIHVGYDRPVLSRKGFGYLIPNKEKENILGVVWDSCVFPEQNSAEEMTRLSVMMGGAQFPGIERLSDNILQTMALESLEKHLSIHAEPKVISVTRAIQSIPQYLVGHKVRMTLVEQKVKNLSPFLTLLGKGFYGISVNDCIAHAQSLVSSPLVYKKASPH